MVVGVARSGLSGGIRGNEWEAMVPPRVISSSCKSDAEEAWSASTSDSKSRACLGVGGD